MIKIKFWLKKSDNDLGNFEYITIDSPQKVLEGKLVGFYTCEVCVPRMEGKQHLIYAINPIDALYLASEFTKTYLQALIKRGYSINEIESKETWKLEKLGDDFLQGKIDELKNNSNMSGEDKTKILEILKEAFGKSPSPIKDQVNSLV